jgi:hypothetical protein
MKLTLSLVFIIISFSAAAPARKDISQLMDSPAFGPQTTSISQDGKTIDSPPENPGKLKAQTEENFYYEMVSTGLLYTEEKPAKFYLNQIHEKDTENKSETTSNEEIRFINSPNPFSSFVQIRYKAPGPAHVTLSIYNMNGEQVALLVNEDKPGGEYVLYYDGLDKDGKSLAEGIYIFCLQVGSRQVISKAILSR